MTQSDHPTPPRGPKRRSDSTHPTSSRSSTRRGVDRRPYPTAPTITKVSPAKPCSVAATSRSRGPASTPIPATVWACGPDPIGLDAMWPTSLVTKIVSSFTEPGGRVVLLPWPTAGECPKLTAVGADGVIDHAPSSEPDAELADALTTIEGLDRTGRVVRVAADPTAAGPGARPFWAELVGDHDPTPATLAQPPRPGTDGATIDNAETGSATTDLIITSLCPEHSGDRASDLVALLAARLLRVGGILVVLTHCDWSGGDLIDPTGAVVASAQGADLLYLQHIAALHAPVRDGHFVLDLGDTAFADAARTRHRAVVRGLPSPHRRLHRDVLVFAQPHDHEPPPATAAEAAFAGGVIR